MITAMLLGALGGVMSIIELFGWLFRPNSHPQVNAITLGLPALLAAGILKRPINERASILIYAATLGVALNRSLFQSQILVHALVFGGSACLMWLTYRQPNADRSNAKLLVLLASFTLGGFFFVWLLGLLA